MAIDLSTVHIQPFRSDFHNRKGFKCRISTLQNFCIANLRKQHESNMVRAYVACAGDSPEVVGFYTLNLSALDIGQVDENSDAKFGRYEAIPAVYLGMVAVHDDHSKCGIGALLMADAIRITAEIADRAGMYALTLDALDETLVTYYSRFGFKVRQHSETGLEMFLPITTIRAALAESEKAEGVESRHD